MTEPPLPRPATDGSSDSDHRSPRSPNPPAGPARTGPASTGHGSTVNDFPAEPSAQPVRSAEPDGRPAPEPSGGHGETRRPLLMDPVGTRPSGFAPPRALSGPEVQPDDPAADRAGIHPTARRPPASPWAPGPTAQPRPGRPHTPSVLAGPTPTGPPGGQRSTPPETVRSESAFGPASRIVTISVRTPSSRIDLALPDRTTMAEVLETVLELAPRSLREQAMAHGGWILRTAAGRPLPGSSTLLDEGVGGGATVYLAGADTAEPAVVHDDLADAVADEVRTATAAWTAGAGRAVALGSCAAFGVLAILATLALGPPWVAPAVTMAVLAVTAQGIAGLLARRRGDGGAALTIGLLSVPAGAAAATVGAAGSAPLTSLGPVPWLAGTLTAGVLAGTASVAVGSHRDVFGAVITSAGLLAAAGVLGVGFGLGPFGTAALVCGLAVCLMPAVPSLSLRMAAFDADPLPVSAQELAAAARRPVDGGDARSRTRRAVHLLIALLHGLAWPTLAAGIVLGLGDAPAGAALAAVVGLAMLLRARLFRTVGQRLPLLLCGVGCLLAVPAGVVIHAESTPTVVLMIAVALTGAVGAATMAGRRTPRTAAMARAAEIGDVLLTIAVIPLVAAVLGAFAFVRGLGG